MSKVVIGHLEPDTDSVVSTIVYSHLRKEEGVEVIPLLTGDLNNETKYVLEKFGVAAPEFVGNFGDIDEVTLVDHNETKQIAPQIDQSKIVEVLDHHRIGDIETSSPIMLHTEPVAATSTILYDMFTRENREINPATAGLMLAGILSDTLEFRSPTTTDHDKEVAEELAKIAGVEDITTFAMDMFKAKSDLSGMSDEEILKNDYKIFTMNGKQVGINVVETTDPAGAKERVASMVDQFSGFRKKESTDMYFVWVVDILNEKSEVIMETEEEKKAIESAFGGEWQNNWYQAGSIVSRKKQIVPPLTEYFAN